MIAVTETAPAKVNLTLHVTGRREDGYHLLESMVAFAGVHDVLEFSRAPEFALSISGPYGGRLPAGPENLVLQAARVLARGMKTLPPCAAIELQKNIPVAAGLGGGSSDAAGCIRGLLRLHGMEASDAALSQVAAGVGADVTVCLRPRASLMSGIGQHVEPAPALPQVPAVLANPGVPLPTAAVFGALGLKPGQAFPAETPASPPSGFRDVRDLSDYLIGCRNDLEAPAARMVREIGDVQEALYACPGCLIARMSGSGPTCFALFENEEEAGAAVLAVAAGHPGWWVAPTVLV